MAIPLDEIGTDELIYVDVREYSLEQLLGEQERCQEVIELNVMSGIDLTTWYDRVNHIEEMRGLLRREMTIGGHNGDN